MCWVYPVSVPSAGQWTSLFGLAPTSAAGIDLVQMEGDTGQWILYIDGNGFDQVNGSDIPTGSWVHVAMVRASGTDIRLYVDGTEYGPLTTNMSGRGSTGMMYLGDTFLDGWFDENIDARVAAIKVWTTNLSQAQIRNEMYSIIPRNYTNLYGFWPVFAGSSERVRDYSVNQRTWSTNGTLTDEAGPPVPWGIFSQSDPYSVVTSEEMLNRGIFRPIMSPRPIRQLRI